MNMVDNRRSFSRSKVGIQATLYIDGLQEEICQVKDVSMSGLFLLTSSQFSLDTFCRVVISLNEEPSGDVIEVHGTIARLTEEGIGIDYETIVGSDSFHHLKNLVLYNSDQPQDTSDEIAQYTEINKERRKGKG